MKKLIITGVLVGILVFSLVGGVVLATGKHASNPVTPLAMETLSGELTATHLADDFPEFVSPEYSQMRHISVTIFATGMDSEDHLYVRAYFTGENLSTLTPVPRMRWVCSGFINLFSINVFWSSGFSKTTCER